MAPSLVAFELKWSSQKRYLFPFGEMQGLNGALQTGFNWVAKHTWPVLCNDSVDDAGLYTVKNKVANSGNEMAIREYGNQGLIYDMSIWLDDGPSGRRT
jgi:hypothetical protein